LPVHAVLKLAGVRPEDESAIAPYLGPFPNPAGLVLAYTNSSSQTCFDDRGNACASDI